MRSVTINRTRAKVALAVLLGALVVGAGLGRVADARYDSLKPPRAAPAGPPTDAFDRPDGPGLGATDDGRPWSESGAWVVRDGGAAAPDADGWVFALTDLGGTDGEVAATMQGRGARQALVVRASDDANLLRVQPMSRAAGWEVVQVRDGDAEQIARSGLASTGPGTTVLVRLAGESLQVAVDGRTVIDVEVPVDPAERFAGVAMARAADDATARWDDFYAVAG